MQFITADAPIQQLFPPGGYIEAPAVVFQDQRNRKRPLDIPDQGSLGRLVEILECDLLENHRLDAQRVLTVGSFIARLQQFHSIGTEHFFGLFRIARTNKI